MFCLPGIGDAILFTPALAALRKAFPDAHITAITMFRGAADLLEANPDVDAVLRFDFFSAPFWESVRHVLRLRRERFDLSILGFPANRLEYNLLNAAVGRRWRAGHHYDHQRWRNLSFLNNVAVHESASRHNVEENLELVRRVCARTGVAMPEVDAGLRVHLTAEDRTWGDAFLAARGLSDCECLIGLHTFSSMFKNMHRKCWDRRNFVLLIERFGALRPGARFLIFSGPSDGPVNDYILGQVGERAVLVAEANLRRALAVLKRCRLFVSNDSALMHLAGALGVPVVALFGPTNWRRLHPWAATHVVVRRDLPCMPCFYYSSRPLRCHAGIDYACMRELAVDDVLAAMQTLLDAPSA